ncbi:hypothetical protein CSA37_00270 [Candidatus Fermentibacteria bacterium]|nr:MAG: hypothetical protein CSA37_00270 [Candidatus Fermentibacteria bacterium]
MNNQGVNDILNSCFEELRNIQSLLDGIGEKAKPTPYVKKYAVIRATGAIETGFKKIIADKVDEDSHEQVKNFIRKKIRESSSNPKLGVIENMLVEFDDRWRAKFDELLALDDKPQLKGSLSKLVSARNDFAHGGNPDVSIENTINYFSDGRKVLEILDAVVNHNFEND